MAEAHPQYERGQEKELKRDVLNWLNLQGAWVFEQRMDKRTRGKCGAPDIIACVDGRFLAIELKVAGNTLQREQEIECERIHSAGGIVCVAYALRDVMAALWKARNQICQEKWGWRALIRQPQLN